MHSNCETSSWVVASTHPHKEQVALENLNRQGFQAYCPRIRKRVRHARQLRQVLRPLFPSYVFVRLDPQQEQWRSIDATFGVRNLIRFGEKPGTIPSQFIASLQATEEEGAVALPKARNSYLPGETVRLREGPFDGLIATVLSANDRERIVVLMDLLKRSVRVCVSINELVPAKPGPRHIVRPELREYSHQYSGSCPGNRQHLRRATCSREQTVLFFEWL